MNDKYVYPQKVLLAWGESIAGNKQISQWLMSNGYKELVYFSMGLRHDEKSKMWLMQAGFPHLRALIDGCEGNAKAIKWLQKKGFEALAMLALAGDGDRRGFMWLKQNQQRELFFVAEKIKALKDYIEERNNDPHKLGY